MNRSRHFSTANCPTRRPNCCSSGSTRDGELRESFGRYALIGEAMRGASRGLVTKGFAGRRESGHRRRTGAAAPAMPASYAPRWWRPLAGAAVAAGVAAVAVVALQQRAITPNAGRPALPRSRRRTLLANGWHEPRRLARPSPIPCRRRLRRHPRVAAGARLTNYVFAHSHYSSGLDQRGVLADCSSKTDEPQPPQ